MSAGARVERDLIGERRLAATTLHGLQTERALENFPPLGDRVGDVPEFGCALGAVKLAAARANASLGAIEPPLAEMLERACEELAAGSPELLAALTVPIIQGGAGTSTNMNVNEVIANRTLELLGREPGEYAYCHPNDHVNRSQSTNDVYPTALRLALIERQAVLDAALRGLAAKLAERADAHVGIVKLGRTQLQDAVVVSAEAELRAWADQCAAGAEGLRRATEPLLEVSLGGTAIGTGIGAHPEFSARAVAALAEATGHPFRPAARLVSATTDPTALHGYSAALRGAAVDLAKLADDLRLLASGPAAGLAEVELPPVQAGSSIMPGKVNPVIPEFVNQLAFRVYGADTAAAHALAAGQLQLNAMLPLVAHELFEAQHALQIAAATLGDRCIDGLSYRHERVAEYAEDGLDELVQAALVSGYAAAGELAALSIDPTTADANSADPTKSPKEGASCRS
ncbi:MAG: aspartate ammonia-lyase [Actinobacteria bacterium]|nr:aspartate ammonia-lyase [Actinomycetota bacterium]